MHACKDNEDIIKGIQKHLASSELSCVDFIAEDKTWRNCGLFTEPQIVYFILNFSSQ